MGFQMPLSKHIVLLTTRTQPGAEESQPRTKFENQVAKSLRGKGGIMKAGTGKSGVEANGSVHMVPPNVSWTDQRNELPTSI